MANEHRRVTWSEGKVSFGGREFPFQAGDTYAALPVGIGTWLTQGERYILFWQSGASEQILQTLPESTYVHDSKNRVIIGEIKCATTASGDFVDGIAAQFDVKVDGLSSSLTSDSFSDTIAFLSREGTAAIPAHSFVGRTDAGMYSGAADQVHFSTAGVERLEITNTGITVAGTANATAYTIGGTALNEYIADTVGTMITSNTETRISVTYDDGDNTLDFVVDDMTGGTADDITVTANNTTDETVYPTFVDGSTGAQGIETDTGLTYNPSTGVLTGTTFAISPPTNDGGVPDTSYGTLRWHEDGGGGVTDTLGLLSGQAFGGTTGVADGANTPTTSNHQSSFWSMRSKIDSYSGTPPAPDYKVSSLVFEPIVGYNYTVDIGDGTSAFYNYPYIGYNNWIYSTLSAYFRTSDASEAAPAYTWNADRSTGFYRIADGHVGYSDEGTVRVNFGGHTVSTLDSGTPPESDRNAYLSVAGSAFVSTYLYAGYVYPVSHGYGDLGSDTRRWDDLWTAAGDISSSDVRLKEDIKPTALGLDFINDLNPVSYKWIDKREGTGKPDQTHYGIIAQEVIETLKDHGIDSIMDFGGIHGKEETYYGSRYQEFIPILMKAVQELSAQIKELKEKN